MRNQDDPRGSQAADLATRWGLPPTSAYADLTAAFVRVPTHTAELVPAGMQFVVDHLRAGGFEPALIPGRPTDILEVVVGNRGPLVMWLAHVDTVPPSRKDHLVPEMREGRVYGLGAVDTKGAIASVMLALPKIAEVTAQVGCRFMMVLVGDEEPNDKPHTIAEYARGLAEAPAVVLAGEPSRGLVSRASKGVLYVCLTVRGQSAHGSRPHLGMDAVEWGIQLRSLIGRLPFTQTRHEAFPDGPVVLNSFIAGGNPDELNKVPAQCQLWFGIRSMLGREGVVEQIERACAVLPDGMTASVTAREPYFGPVAVDPGEPLFTTLCDVVGSELPSGSLAWTTQDGASDLSFLPWDVPLMEWGVPGGGHHGPDEYMMPEGARQYSGQLVEYLHRVGQLTQQR